MTALRNSATQEKESCIMLPQNAERLLRALGYFDHYSKLYVRAFSAKKMPMDVRLNYDTAYRKNGSILPLSPMGTLDLGTEVFTPSNGLLKGQPQAKGWDFIAALNRKPQGIYFTVNPGGQNIADITESRALFYEIDNLNKEEQWAKLRELEAELGHQLTVVETRNSLHVYLILTAPITDLALWTRYQQRLIQKMGSDISIHNPNRVLRLPDFDYWSWDSENQTPVNHGPIVLHHIGEPLDLSMIDAVLPAWETTQWSPPTDRPRPNYSGPSEFLDYWDMKNIAIYLPGYNAQGRQGGWATAQCPHQGPGHSGNPSVDSLHIAPDGAFKCHAGCDGSDVLEASIRHACTMGYPTLEQWARAKGLWREKSVPIELPSSTATAPPLTDFPEGLIPVKSMAVVDDLPSGDYPPDAPIEGEPPNTVIVSEPLVPIPEADNPELAYVHDKVRGDGKGTTLLGAAIRSLVLSPEGQNIVSRYCWVFNKDEFFDLTTQVTIQPKQLIKRYDGKTGFFKKASNWIQLPQGDKPKRVSIIDLLDAYDRQVFDYGYAPGQPQLIPPVEGEDLPRANLWKPPPTGHVGATSTDVELWLERLYNFIPGEAGDYFLQFLAHTVQQPEVKCDFAPILYTEKRRSGREQLLSPVLEMFKRVNQGIELACTSFDPRYTDALMGKRLVIFNEVKKPTGREFPDPNHWFKNHIGHSADTSKLYTRKGLGAIYMEDYTNFILITNEQDAITIMEDEGRYWPIETSWKGPEEDYINLGRFYDQGGMAKVWGYLHTVDLTGFSPYRPRLDLSNFAEFCGATEADARTQVLDMLNELHDPFIAHHEVKQYLGHIPEVQDARTFRKLIANSPWAMSSDKKDRVSSYEGRKQIKSHLIYQKTIPFVQARALYTDQQS